MKSILKSVTVFMSIMIISINCGNGATTSATSAGTTTTTTNIDCVSQPYNSSLTVSSPTSVSHRPGQECLTGCHNTSTSGPSAGTTVVRWNVAGTMYTSTLGPVVVSNTPKTTGTITIGGVTIPVDKCGNFYYFNSTTAPTGIASTSTVGVAAMTTAIGASNSNCNAGNACHSAFNGTNDGTAGTRIY